MFTNTRLWSRTAGRGWGRRARPLVRRSPEGRQGHFARRRSEERERRERYLDPRVHQARGSDLVLVYRGPRDSGGRLRFLLKPSFVIRDPEIAVCETKSCSQASGVFRQQAAGALTTR